MLLTAVWGVGTLASNYKGRRNGVPPPNFPLTLTTTAAAATDTSARVVPLEEVGDRLPAAADAHHDTVLDGTYEVRLLSVHLVAELRTYTTRTLSISGRSAGNWTARGYANSRIANSRTGQVADWTTRGLADAAKQEN